MSRLTEYSLWLMEPRALQRAARKALAQPCPTAREVAHLRHSRLVSSYTPDVLWHDPPFARDLSSAKTKSDSRPLVGLIPIHGPIQQRLTPELMKCGGTACDEISASLDALLSDHAVTSILLHIDSPGGASYGVEELAEKIHAARGQKPIYAIADSVACSAAYWLGCAADKFYATPGGDVGSVGVYMLHINESKALEQEGIQVSFVTAGEHKVEGNPFEPLSAEAREHWQEQVNYTYAKFTRAIARYRGLPEETVAGKDFGQGRVLNPTQALSAKMIDHVLSFDDLVRQHMNTPTNSTTVPARTGPSVEVLRARHEHRKRTAAAAAEEEPAGPKEGDKVKFKEGQEHEPFEAGVEYIVRQISTPALGLATADDPERIMRWATAGELEPAGGGEEAPAAEVPAEEMPA